MQSDIQRWRDTATYDISEKTYIYNIIDSTYSIIIFLKKLHKNKRSGFYSEFWVKSEHKQTSSPLQTSTVCS